MNSRTRSQQLKSLSFIKAVIAIVLATPSVASAAATIDIKDTNYPIPADAYFVSPNGKHTNSGRAANSPWSVSKALALAPSGSTIVFRGGTYRNIDLNIKKKLTLQAYPHEKPWLKGSIEVQDWVANGGIWRKDGWKYSFPPDVGSEYIDPKHPMAAYRDMVYINSVSLKQVASIAKVTTGTFYVDSVNNKLYIGDNPAGKTVEATALQEGFSTWKNTWSNPSNTVVRGLGFAHYANQGLSVAAPHVTLENNTFAWNGVQGVRFWKHSSGKVGISSDAILRGNTFSYNGRKGLGGQEARRLLLEGNTISYNNVERFAKAWDAAGVKFGLTDGITWRNNTIEHNFATGIWSDSSVSNATIVNNTVRNNEGIGIHVELSHKAIVAANLVHNNGLGIMVADSSSVRVYNNTLSMNTKHIIVKDSPRVNTNAAEFAKGITWITRNNVIKNNILSSTTGGVHLDALICNALQQSKLMVTAINHNAYYRTSSSMPLKVVKWSLGAGKCGMRYGSIAAFKSATGYEANALVVDNVATNPFFVNAANNDYRLKPNSPASRRGEALPTDIAKAVGWLPGMSVDLGAVQSKAVLVQ